VKKNRAIPTKAPEDPQSSSGYPTNTGREWVVLLMERVNEIARLPDLSAVIEAILGMMLEINQAECAIFFQIDNNSDELVVTHVKGNSASTNLIGLRINRKHGLPGITVCDTQLLVVGDLTYESDWLHALDPLGSLRNRNVINLPVTCGEQSGGVVQIFNFQRAELDVLKVLGDRLGLEIDTRTRIDSAQRSNQRLQSLVEVLGEVGGTLDRNHLLYLITENASRLVGAERSSVFLVDPSTREMIFQVAYQSQEQDPDHEPAPAGTETPAGNEEIKSGGKTRLRKEPLSQSPQSEFSFFNRSAITVPLRTNGNSGALENDPNHVLGGLMVLNKSNAAFQEEDARLMRILASQASTFLQVAEMYENSSELFLGVIKALAAAIDAKDPCTQGHSQRVSDYSVMMARELGLDEAFINDLRIGSLFHDIGKIGIPDVILLKKGRISDQEREYVRLHPQMGVNILSQVKLLESMLPAIQEHHERLDGSGYPSKLKGRQISWMGRIVAVADVYDAMTSNRPYRVAISREKVLKYLIQNSDTLFDAECVHALVEGLSHLPAQR
jgi:putative nucleotidyltransferase with HDIG domain